MHPASGWGLLMCILSCVFFQKAKWRRGWREATAGVTLQKQQWLCKLVWLKLSSSRSLAWGYAVCSRRMSRVFYSTKTVCSNKWELSFRSISPEASLCFHSFYFKCFQYKDDSQIRALICPLVSLEVTAPLQLPLPHTFHFIHLWHEKLSNITAAL